MTYFVAQSNLNKGEIDQTLEGRIDTELYYNGLFRARNVKLRPQGGAVKRGGFEYLYKFPSSGEPDLLKTFSFNEVETYVLAFYFALSPAASRIYIFKNGTLQTNINGSGLDYLSTTLLSPTGLTNRGEYYYIQSANTAIIFSSLQPVVLTRTSDTSWQINSITFTNVPQFDYNDASSPTPTNEVQQITFTAANESDTFKLSIDGFLSDDIAYTLDTTEMEERLRAAIQAMPNTANSGVSVANSAANIYDITFGGESADSYGLTQAVAVLTRDAAFQGVSTRTTPGTGRKEDAFSSTRGWPSCGVFHQGRLYMGGVTELPDAIFGSVVGDFFNFDAGKARDDESIFVTLQTDQVNAITSMISSRKLQVFTEGGEFYCPNDVITPSEVRFDAATSYGAADIKPVTIDGQVIFPQSSSKALIINSVENQYQPITSRNLAVTIPHLMTTVRDLEVARGSSVTDANYVYILTQNFDIICLNYLPSENVEGFSLIETSGSITAITVAQDELYVLVNRGGDVFLEKENEDYPVDCGVSISSSSTVDTSHYTGTIEVLGDGAYLGEFTSSASVTLPRTVTSGYAGVGFRPKLTTNPLNQAISNGPNYGQKKRVRRAILQIYESNGVVVKNIIDDAERTVVQIPDKTIGGNQFDAPIPYTGVRRIPLYGYGIKNQIEVTQTTPLPFFILSIGAEMKT